MVVEYEGAEPHRGEIQQMGDDFLCNRALAGTFAGKAPGRRTAEKSFSTLWVSRSRDFSLRHSHQLACDRSIGREIELVPELADRDLFGSLHCLPPRSGPRPSAESAPPLQSAPWGAADHLVHRQPPRRYGFPPSFEDVLRCLCTVRGLVP